ncbi:Spermidine synthase [Methyloligella halotolerans]|uniref:Spermidine synthase n=1 Tax=Methyloligella halotolerans TaxID=1177755 RepID=A0A1E2RVR0_9HYPH|nr:fused MFS/spermidine synthase [Methyloligella halotolerans]ODA66178.1 Spermidine synthase [Methyloligella halotolerans]
MPPLGGKLMAAAALIVAALPTLLQAADEPELIERRESKYTSIFVHSLGRYISLSFGMNERLYVESKANPDDPLELPSAYAQYMTVAMAYPEKPARLLEIGLGGGTVVSYLHKTYPDLNIQAVELDPVVADMAKKYFFLDEGPRLKVAVRDGRIFLLRSKEKYDAILIDAYQGPSIPFHLMTREFFELTQRHLNPGGVLVQNLESNTLLYDAAVATIGSVYDNVEVYKAATNYILVAYDGPPKTEDLLRRQAERLEREADPRYPPSELVKDRQILTDFDGQVLTDDYAPVEASIP